MASAGPDDEAAASPAAPAPIHRDKHIRYFLSCLNGLTFHYAASDQTRLMMVYFSVVALDIMGSLDRMDRQPVIEWIYYLQVDPDDQYPDRCGFRGSPWFMREKGGDAGAEYDTGHIAMSYVALACLRTLGDDYSRVKRNALLASLERLQQKDGSFLAFPYGNEKDMRFVFCACAVSSMLRDWSGVDRERVISYIRSCRSYDGGIALIPGQESHGGSTYCALAALELIRRSFAEEKTGTAAGKAQLPGLTPTECDEILHWCLYRQVSGFQGRCNKDPDTCYSFWIGSAITLLSQFGLVDCTALRDFHVSCLDMRFGGFAKYPGTHSDVLHSFYSVCFLAMSSEPGFRPLDCGLAVCSDKTVSALLTVNEKQQQDDKSGEVMSALDGGP